MAYQKEIAMGTYQSTHLTSHQIDFLKLLDDYEVVIFTLDTVEEALEQPIAHLNEVVENLTQKGLLSRIERGKYCRHNFRDELVIGSFLVRDGGVAYWSALNRHGLTEQFANTVFVQTSQEKKAKRIFGVDYKFVKVHPRKVLGYELQGYGNATYQMTDVEKTLVDCFDLPQYSGGYAELIRAFADAELDAEKMITYCQAVQNIAATKRMGYLAELLEKTGIKKFIQYAQAQVNPKYNLFDPQGTEEGDFVADWKLRMNLSEAAILSIRDKAY
jgi:predicted transcriptional regulator of viral defense system